MSAVQRTVPHSSDRLIMEFVQRATHCVNDVALFADVGLQDATALLWRGQVYQALLKLLHGLTNSLHIQVAIVLRSVCSQTRGSMAGETKVVCCRADVTQVLSPIAVRGQAPGSGT